MATQLATTSYAILGQLALRPWTTYELAKEIRRNFHYFWPRAESGIYAEIKRLAARGLATAERSYVGKRPRTTYSITPAGRTALDAWLATPIKSHALEFEGLMRVFFAPFGTYDELLAALRQAERDSGELLDLAVRIRSEYLAGRAPFQEQIHIRVFVYDFLLSYARMVHDWAVRTQTEIADWDDLSLEGKQERALATFQESFSVERPNPTH